MNLTWLDITFKAFMAGIATGAAVYIWKKLAKLDLLDNVPTKEETRESIEDAINKVREEIPDCDSCEHSGMEASIKKSLSDMEGRINAKLDENHKFTSDVNERLWNHIEKGTGLTREELHVIWQRSSPGEREGFIKYLAEHYGGNVAEFMKAGKVEASL